MPRDYPFVGGPDREAAVREWIVAGSAPSGVEPRPAATVVIAREGAAGPEVIMLKRSPTMVFAASMFAFPGGGVDPADTGAAVDPSVAAAAASAMDVDTAEAHRHLAAAVREVREEAGIDLDPADLVPLGRWVTPVFDRHRFDTWILAAALPEGQELTPQTSEAVLMEWVSPSEVLDRFERRELIMLPPTIHALRQVVAAGSVTAYLRTPTNPTVITPRLVDSGDGIRLRVET